MSLKKPQIRGRAPFEGERVIRLKCVMGLPLFVERPTYLQVCRWWKYGIAGTRLETFRQGKYRFTSEEAVARFMDKINE